MSPLHQNDLQKILIDLADQTTGRTLVAIAGAPGAGKSTIAEHLASDFNQQGFAFKAASVPMDGFHYDNAVLEQMGKRDTKGAPDTFDVMGFASLLQRLRLQGDVEDIAIPLFDRNLEISRNAARIITSNEKLLIVEGNYLLLNQGPWANLHSFFDLTVMLDVPLEELERRLIDRWISFGLDAAGAREKALQNDIPNARLVVEHAHNADYMISQGTVTNNT